MHKEKNRYLAEAQQVTNSIVESLEQTLLQLDELGLTMAAVKVAEAIDLLKDGPEESMKVSENCYNKTEG